jgi:hypothetical protein
VDPNGHKRTPYEEMKALQERMNEGVRRAARRRLAGVEKVELPEVEGEEPEGSADGWLFDSSRDYLEQLRHYKER